MAVDYRKLIGDGKCVKCRGPLGLVFWRVRIDRGVINAAATRRQLGLSMFLGSDALADVFSPEREPLVQFTSEVEAGAGTLLCLCDGCFLEHVPGLAELVEVVNEREKAASTT